MALPLLFWKENPGTLNSTVATPKPEPITAQTTALQNVCALGRGVLLRRPRGRPCGIRGAAGQAMSQEGSPREGSCSSPVHWEAGDQGTPGIPPCPLCGQHTQDMGSTSQAVWESPLCKRDKCSVAGAGAALAERLCREQLVQRARAPGTNAANSAKVCIWIPKQRSHPACESMHLRLTGLWDTVTPAAMQVQPGTQVTHDPDNPAGRCGPAGPLLPLHSGRPWGLLSPGSPWFPGTYDASAPS